MQVVRNDAEALVMLHLPLWVPLLRVSLAVNLFAAAVVLALVGWSPLAALLAVAGVAALWWGLNRLELTRLELDHQRGSWRIEGIAARRRFKHELARAQIREVQVALWTSSTGGESGRPELHFRDGRPPWPLFVQPQQVEVAKRVAAELNAHLREPATEVAP